MKRSDRMMFHDVEAADCGRWTTTVTKEGLEYASRTIVIHFADGSMTTIVLFEADGAEAEE